MLSIIMRKPKKEDIEIVDDDQDEEMEDQGNMSKKKKGLNVNELLRGKHVLIVHCDQLLIQFVKFINKYPIQNVEKRILMPGIFAIIDNLTFENMNKTGNCMDQILLSLSDKLKPTLRDIYTKYHQSKIVKHQ